MTGTGPVQPDRRVSVVIATRNRRDSLRRSLNELERRSGRVRTILVDNGSSDGTAESIRQELPWVDVLELATNLGSAGRTIGVCSTETPYIAFCDDDSWWADGALSRAADLLGSAPRLGLIAGQVLLGEEQRTDPTCLAMAESPLSPSSDVPGVPVLGFIACGAVVRRAAYLAVGGFHPRFGVGGEEELLALDLMSLGWRLSYVSDVVAHHHPSPARNVGVRRRIVTRNALWCYWLRRPWPIAGRATIRAVARACCSSTDRVGLVEAIQGLPWVLRERRRLPHSVEEARRRLESISP